MYYSNPKKMRWGNFAPTSESLANDPIPVIEDISQYFPFKINSNDLYFRYIPATVTPFEHGVPTVSETGNSVPATFHVTPGALCIVSTVIHIIPETLSVVLFTVPSVSAKLPVVSFALPVVSENVPVVPGKLHVIPETLRIVPGTLHIVSTTFHIVPEKLPVVPTAFPFSNFQIIKSRRPYLIKIN
jgi:hypothetical protein